MSIRGIYEVCIGLPDAAAMNEAVEYWAQFGYTVSQHGQLDAAQAEAAYGLHSALQSLRLGHQDADHGLIRLMQWATPRNNGLGLAAMKVLGSRWATTMTDDIYNLVNHAEDAIAAQLPIHWVSPQRQQIYPMPVGHKPFVQPAPCVREACMLQPYYRQVLFQRFGYSLPHYGKTNATSHFKASQVTHVGLVIQGDEDPLRFYDEVLGLLRIRNSPKPATAASVGPANIFDLHGDECYYTQDFDDPRSSATDLMAVRSGRLKFIRFVGGNSPEDWRDRSQPGCLGMSCYTYAVSDIAEYHARVTLGGARDIFNIAINEFGERSLRFTAPDGTVWLLVQC
jgi:catechol 2,3-dioxygenase-like lactoylglutathione lyase family enzyme